MSKYDASELIAGGVGFEWRDKAFWREDIRLTWTLRKGWVAGWVPSRGTLDDAAVSACSHGPNLAVNELRWKIRRISKDHDPNTPYGKKVWAVRRLL